MCHAHLDPKYQMRDMEARLKRASFQAPVAGPRAPVLAGLRTMLARTFAKQKQKGQAHV